MIDQISALSSATDGILKSTNQTRFAVQPGELGNMGGTADVPGASFSQTMAAVSQDAIDRVKQGEAAALAGVDGQASVQQVVEAVMAAETSLRTAIAIRDKVVTAYQEISRMTI
ncbi:flagellar hook-basal body complex protein FliE [Roseibium aquae]|uniref:Flagellar hook-basal body complex protein FliE n=1 Tax=Roseibium aquae TaxID=1323746 RepID=A0A916X396_9HYPH|nr:flagellar hook-basal body complex protein FliE [Roseibium aquae]GGB60138.1 flagellar hook-basal body complex protein FliE [Roseibium aquae]